MLTVPDQVVLRCSFCNKAREEVRKLIAGPVSCICNECVEVCSDIIRQENEPTAAAEPSSRSQPTPTTFAVSCGLCGLNFPIEDALVILNRGFLCPGCSGEVEVSLAQKRESVSTN